MSIACLWMAVPAQAKLLTLDQAVVMALENSARLRADDANTAMMQASVQDARSDFLPKIDTRFVYPFIGTETGISLNQPIWDFRKTAHLVQSKEAQVASLEFDKAVNREDIVLQTKIAYYTVLMLQATVASSEATVREREARLERDDGFFKIGRLSPLDVTKSRIELGNVRVGLINAKKNLDEAIIQLHTLLGTKEAKPYELEPMLSYHDIQINIEDEIKSAFAARSELKSLSATAESRRAELSAAKQDHYPMIFGRAEFRIRGEGAEQPGIIVGIGMRYRLFDGFAKMAKIRHAQASLEQSIHDQDALLNQIVSEARLAYARVTAAGETIRIAEQSKKASEDNLTLTTERYRIGRASIVELAESNALLAASTAAYAQAVYSYKIAIAQLERAVGKKIDE